MLKIFLISLLPFLFPYSSGSNNPLVETTPVIQESNTGTLEKMIVANGSVVMDVNLNKLNGTSGSVSRFNGLRFNVKSDSFFTVIAFNGELRGALPGAMPISPQNTADVPAKLSSSYQKLIIENKPWGGQYDLVIRDNETGFVFFNIEGYEANYDAKAHILRIADGRLLISPEFAEELGRPNDAGAIVGQISVDTNLSVTEVQKVVEGETTSSVLPAGAGTERNAGSVPGPDVIVGDLTGLQQFGSSSGTQVGLAVGTDSCNLGVVDLDWFANPSNNHPVIPQNLYRMSGGTSNNDRFEQIGQSSVKHAFTALTNNLCGLGCNGVGGTRLGSGCSDPYSASLNAGSNNALGSRAWINPFSGVYPRNDGGATNNSHTGHTHAGPTHRILTEMSDLSTALNPGATYYSEGQYITPHEYVWCSASPANAALCEQNRNLYNNVSYRRYNVTGTASPFSFSPAAATERQKPAISAWAGATLVEVKPSPGVDGIAIVGYKVTNPSAGVWHYEYAIYNQNLDRAIQSFSVPLGNGATLSNIGFHAPPQHAASTNDGTFNSLGFSSAAWTQTQVSNSMTWNSETFAQNPNANAIRWGTLYNFRFDSNRPPQNVNATIGFLKTGDPMTVQIQGPSAASVPVTVSGRVVTANGRGISRAWVSITDSSNNTRSVKTSSFGYYHFDNVLSGSSYTVRASARRFTFAPRVVTISDNLANYDFVPVP